MAVESSIPDSQTAADFPSTHWSLVALAGSEDELQRRAALDAFHRQYGFPMAEYLVRGRGLTRDAAEEIVQGFFADKVIEQRILERTAQGKGKLRLFLMRVLTNYANQLLRRSRAAKRGGRVLHQSVQHVAVPDDSRNPVRLFDAAWARATVAQAVELFQSECLASQRMDLWQVFSARLLNPALDGSPAQPYEDLVQSLGLDSTFQAQNLLATAKRSFSRQMRKIVGAYCVDSTEIERELAELRRALSCSAAESSEPGTP
jgi:DNA-directed RNA polymerase specialized sigma24 family protein